jgi:cytochrome c oxidase subunit 1
MAAYNLLSSLKNGKKAPNNPWGSATLEWACSSPPPHHNFDTPPPITDPYDLESLVWDPETEGYVRVEGPVAVGDRH